MTNATVRDERRRIIRSDLPYKRFLRLYSAKQKIPASVRDGDFIFVMEIHSRFEGAYFL